MFNTSKINTSDLTNLESVINYDDSLFKSEGFKLRYVLNPKNPMYSQVISECKAQNILYKLVPIENNQEHIWIKEN